MAHELDIDADLSLSETEDVCEVEQIAGWQLANIRFDTVIDGANVFKVNKAKFDLKLTDRLNDLSFVEVGAGDDPDKIKEDMGDEGWTWICDSQIYIQNHINDIIVFGKQTE